MCLKIPYTYPITDDKNKTFFLKLIPLWYVTIKLTYVVDDSNMYVSFKNQTDNTLKSADTTKETRRDRSL